MEHSAEVEIFPLLVENFPLWWIFFSATRPSRLPNLSPKMQSGNFSTLVENFPLSKSCKKKNFFCRIAWIGTFCRGRKFSTFGGKLSTLVKFYFRHLDLRVCQISSPMDKIGIFSTLVEKFALSKIKKKTFFLQLFESGKFSTKVENFPLCIFGLKFGKREGPEPENKISPRWKIFHQK